MLRLHIYHKTTISMLTRSFQLYSSGPLPVTLSCNTRVLSNNDDNSTFLCLQCTATMCDVLWKKVSGLEFGPQAFNSREIYLYLTFHASCYKHDKVLKKANCLWCGEGTVNLKSNIAWHRNTRTKLGLLNKVESIC